ncbi:MAG: lipoyl synthase [Elusimicrobia bacterium]|nr:lipoyl synthase [Elusimicrobiota bacterium]
MRPRLPEHFKQTVPSGRAFFQVSEVLGRQSLPTVCQEALCPNRTDCWARGTLAFQILGSVCTRRCSFCAETTGRPGPVDSEEPRKLAEAVKNLRLKHVVITSPARDDLPDQGAGQFAACVETLHREVPGVLVETLIPDFQGRPDLLNLVFQTQPDILNHNVETVRRLTPQVRARARYERSLDLLKAAAEAGLVVKSGLMVGLGETEEELLQTFNDLKSRGVRCLTVGQYLPPSPGHFPARKFYTVEEFQNIRRQAEVLFERVMAGPLVRSSYHADEMVTS